MIKILDFMSEDHDRLDRILRGFQQAREKVDLSRARNLFQEFNAGFQQHLDWEEEILFPLIERRTGMHLPGPSTAMHVEHQQIKALLKQIEDAMGKKTAGAEESIQALAEMLTVHVKREEKVLYPWIDMTLTELEREEALNKMTETTATDDRKRSH